MPDFEEGDWDFSVCQNNQSYVGSEVDVEVFILMGRCDGCHTCTVSFLPGSGLCGGVAGEGLGDPGSSFLRAGARSKPLPGGERGALPTGEDASWERQEKDIDAYTYKGNRNSAIEYFD